MSVFARVARYATLRATLRYATLRYGRALKMCYALRPKCFETWEMGYTIPIGSKSVEF